MVALALSAVPVTGEAQQQMLAESAKLVAADGQAGDHFGDALALHAGTLVVGAPDDDDRANDAGAAYVFELTGPDWLEVQKLVAQDGEANDRFGERVVIEGDTLAVSASNHDVHGDRSGAVYVFTRSAGAWTQEAKLAPADGLAHDRFGCDLALDGARLLVGASGSDAGATDAGAAYLFERGPAGWALEQKLAPGVPIAERGFGTSVAISGERLAIGAPLGGVDPYVGHVYCFLRTATAWVQTQIVAQPYGAGSAEFGRELSITADRLAVGMPSGIHSDVLLYGLFDGRWLQLATCLPGTSGCCAGYGRAIDLEGEVVVGGAWNGSPSGTGKSIVSHRYGSWCAREAWLRASDGAPNDELGTSIALEGDVVASGAPGDDDRGDGAGAVYVHALGSLHISTPFCFGDGSGSDCPCDNETLPGYGGGCANMGRDGGSLFATGTTSMSADDLTVWAYSDDATIGTLIRADTRLGDSIPFGDGLLCIAGDFVRVGLSGGNLMVWPPSVDIEIPGGWAPGDSVLFQVWYRVQPQKDLCGAFYNLTNALELTFRP